MKKHLPALLLAAALSLGAFTSLQAGAAPDPILTALTDAAQLRNDTAVAVTKGEEKPAAAIIRLKAIKSPSGLKIDHDADVGFALIDVGHRLLAESKPVEAEVFFQEAEKSLQLVLNKTPDSDAANKAMFLQNIAFIRANYLNKAKQARADLDSATRLSPDDQFIKQLRDGLLQANPESPQG